MEEILVTRINAGGAARKIDYNALANLPTSDKTLEVDGGFADAKEVGDRLKNISESIVNASLSGLGVEATAAELNYMKGVTSNVQEQLNAKQYTITGAATTIVKDDLDADKVLVSNADGKVGASAITVTELGYVGGVKSNIQEQIDAAVGNIATLTARPVNNNILINSNFANPVNQRNITDVNYVGGFTIDRWKAAAAHLEHSSGYMTMSFYGETQNVQNPILMQYVDYHEQYVGKSLTASIKYAVHTDAENAVATLRLKTSDAILGALELTCDGKWHIGELTVTDAKIVDFLAFTVELGDKTSSIDLEWAKLEVGNVATPYASRLPAEELCLCKMYYQAFDVTSGSTRGIDGDEFHFYVTVPQTMRISGPDIITDGLTIKCCNLEVGGTMVIEGAYIGSDSTAANTFINKLFLQCCLPENHGITVGHHPYVEGVVILDAEI